MNLTPEQQEAISINHDIFVEAGAGSGKTTILVQRFIRILKENPNCTPQHILALTFTEKAAGEMLTRIYKDVSNLSSTSMADENLKSKILDSLYLAKVSTIHSFCMNILKRFPLEANIDPHLKVLQNDRLIHFQKEILNQTLYTLQEQENTHLKVLLLTFSNIKLKKLLLFLCTLKDRLIDEAPEKANEILKKMYEKNIEIDEKNKLTSKEAQTLTNSLLNIFSVYQNNINIQKENRNLYDFNDLIKMTHCLLKENYMVRNILSNEIKFIMVDEFQDTDPVQWEIISLLRSNMQTDKTPINLFVVGDLKQSIYSFRGADARLFQTIQSSFKQSPKSKIVFLQDNFRSEPHLINFINAFFQPLLEKSHLPINYQRLLSKISQNTGQTTIQLFDKNDIELEKEIAFIANWIEKEKNNNNFEDFAILTRRKKSMKTLEEKLIKRGIPCVVHSGHSDIKTPEVISLYNLIKGLLNKEDNLAWIAVLKSSWFGISDETIFILYEYSKQPNILDKLYEAAQNSVILESVPDVERHIIKHAVKQIPQWMDSISYYQLSVFVNTIIKENEFLFSFSVCENYKEKINALQHVLNQIKKYEEQAFTTKTDLSDYLDTLIQNGYLESEDIKIVPGAVQLLSIHASKGLEFPFVIIPEAGKRFNLSQNDPIILSKEKEIGLQYNPGGTRNEYRDHILKSIKPYLIDEEKRVFYVACTRAKKGLCIVGHTSLDPKKIKKSYHSYADFILHECEYDEKNNHLKLNTNEDKQLTFKMEKDINCNYKEIDIDKKADKIESITPRIVKKQPYHSSQITPISTTALVRYLKCPKHYFYHDLISQNLIKKSTQTKTQYNPQTALLIGNIMHDSIDWLNSNNNSNISLKLGIDLKVLSHSLDNVLTFKQAMKIILKNELYKTLLNNINDLHIPITTQLNILINSTLFKTLRETINLNKTLIKSEFPFKILINNSLIEGRFDTIIKHKDEWEIIDYKTDKLKENEVISYAQKYRNQLGIYSLGLQSLLKEKQEAIKTTIYFSQIGISHTIQWSQSDLKQFANSIENISDLIKEKIFTPPKLETCYICPLYHKNINCRSESII